MIVVIVLRDGDRGFLERVYGERGGYRGVEGTGGERWWDLR